MKRVFYLISAIVVILIISHVSPAVSQDGAERIERLEEDIEALKEEIASLGDGGYGLSEGTYIDGYGELHYNNFWTQGKTDEMDFHRFVLFIAHEFNDWVKFDSELEVEHALAGEGQNGEVALEQAFIDLLFTRPLSVRAGLVLVPLGIINETHEPPTFYGVERPDVDKNIGSSRKSVGHFISP